jgi:hypothetical protein
LTVSVKEGLSSLSFIGGLGVFKELMEDEVEYIVCPERWHNVDRTANGQGCE